MNRSQRNEFVNQQIIKLNSLLEQWERFQVTARDPGEKEHSKGEVQRLKQLLFEYESELNGGLQVNEKIHAPLTAPAIRKNNRKWILGILLALLIIAAGAFFYLKSNEVIPDYSKYLNYLNQGDSLVKVSKYPEAKVSYKKALQYNPGDSAVIKKIDYLKKADDLVAQNKFTEAKEMFKVVVEIMPSAGLSSKAIAIKKNSNEKNADDALHFSFEWKDGLLIITVSGGTPFTGNGMAPYEVEGLDCKDCIQWSSEADTYKGKVQQDKVRNFSIRIKDSKGIATDAQIPAYNTTAAGDNISPVTNPDNTNEENYIALLESGDKNFAENNFTQALSDYIGALNLKPGSKELTAKIASAKKEVEKGKLIAARDIPRVNIAGNSFTMGYENGFPVERPEHKVQLGAFSLGKTEVTVAQYRAYCGFTNRSMPATPSYGWIDENPITNVSWQEAKNYCEWVGGRLPTEAEWEYAATEAGASNKTYSGSNELGRVAIYKDNSGNRPANVAHKQPNALGLYDMTGNVSEWCSDWFSSKYYAGSETVNPKGPPNGTEKVIRGGGFNSSIPSTQDGNQLRVTYRNQKEPTARENYIGFRVLWER